MIEVLQIFFVSKIAVKITLLSLQLFNNSKEFQVILNNGKSIDN